MKGRGKQRKKDVREKKRMEVEKKEKKERR